MCNGAVVHHLDVLTRCLARGAGKPRVLLSGYSVPPLRFEKKNASPYSNSLGVPLEPTFRVHLWYCHFFFYVRSRWLPELQFLEILNKRTLSRPISICRVVYEGDWEVAGALTEPLHCHYTDLVRPKSWKKQTRCEFQNSLITRK